MARHKKNKSLQVKEKEVNMKETIEAPTAQDLDNIQTEVDLARLELEKIKQELEESKKQLAVVKERDLDEVENRIVEKQIAQRSEDQGAKAKIAAQKARDNERVTGKFINRRAPGQEVKLPYIKYEDDPVKWYSFRDGGTYTIPRGFADQLNGGTPEDPCYYTPHFIQKQGPMDPDNPESQIHAVDTSNHKYAFVPIGF